MNVDDLILVSIDDHVVEPPDMFLNHVPAKYKAEAPVVVTDEKGVDQWMYQGRPQGVSGLNAVVSWPPEEWGRDPARFAEMRPGVYDVHERVRDMNRNGILASMCFPSFPGMCGNYFAVAKDHGKTSSPRSAATTAARRYVAGSTSCSLQVSRIE